MKPRRNSRREFLQRAVWLSAGLAVPGIVRSAAEELQGGTAPLGTFGYGDVTLNSELHQQQLDNTHAVLMGLNETEWLNSTLNC